MLRKATLFVAPILCCCAVLFGQQSPGTPKARPPHPPVMNPLPLGKNNKRVEALMQGRIGAGAPIDEPLFAGPEPEVVADPDTDSGQILRNTAEDDRRARELERRVKRNIDSNRLNLAIDDLKQLITIKPYDANYQLTLGLLFRKVVNLEEARRKYQDYLDLGGHPAVAHLLFADSYAAMGDKEKVYENLRKAAENGMNIMQGVSMLDTLEPYRSDTDFIKLALQLEQYKLDLTDKVDPFTNRFKKKLDEQVTREVRISKRWSKEKQEEVLRTAHALLARIERYLSREDEDRAMESYTELLDLTKTADKFTIPRLAAEFRGIIDRKEEIESRIEEIRLKYYYRQARNKIDEMRRHFRNQDYPQVEIVYNDVVGIAREMVKVNSEFKEVSDTILRAAQGWLAKANVHREFESKSLKIQGIVAIEKGAWAIVNNRILRVGEPLEDMVVVAIQPNQIIFNYKGERIPLIFRRY